MTEAELVKMYSDAGFDPKPYLIQYRKQQKFKKEYYEVLHIYCPECGNDKYSSTYVGYIISPTNPEAFKDGNEVVCSKCGWTGITHDLVRKKPKRKK